MKQSVCTMERLFFFFRGSIGWLDCKSRTLDIQRPEKLFGYLDPFKKNIIYIYIYTSKTRFSWRYSSGCRPGKIDSTHQFFRFGNSQGEDLDQNSSDKIPAWLLNRAGYWVGNQKLTWLLEKIQAFLEDLLPWCQEICHVSKHHRVCAFVSKALLRLAGELILTMKLIRDLELQRDGFRVVFPEGDGNNHSFLEDIVFFYLFFLRQLWLVIGVKLMEIKSHSDKNDHGYLAQCLGIR